MIRERDLNDAQREFFLNAAEQIKREGEELIAKLPEEKQRAGKAFLQTVMAACTVSGLVPNDAAPLVEFVLGYLKTSDQLQAQMLALGANAEKAA